MTQLFTPKAPSPMMAAPPPSPTSEDPAVAKETARKMQEAADQERRARGRASTLITGGAGDTGTPSISRRMLLGT